MTLQEVQIKLKLPQYKKYLPYLHSFWILTEDEQDRVVANHSGFTEFLKLFNLEMKFLCEQLSKALEAGNYSGRPFKETNYALQVEDLEVIFKRIKFTE